MVGAGTRAFGYLPDRPKHHVTMSEFDPLAAIGLLTAAREDVAAQSYGTCFLFRHDRVALTAAHCVPDSIDLAIAFPKLRRTQRVSEIHRHPIADIAVLITNDVPSDSGAGYPPTAFWNRVGNWSLGEEFITYGYPADNASLPMGASAPRLFVGHYQRFFNASTPAGYQYLAGEVSIPIPIGMSGSPLFRRGAPVMVTGLLTTSIESYTITDSVEERTEGGTHYRLEARKIVSYGVALMLSDVSDWLAEVLPSRDIGW